MNKIFILTLLPFLLVAETTMKCETGKCSGGKVIPEKPMQSKSSMKRPTIEQLFNVKTVQAKIIDTSKSQINHGYIVAQDSAKVDVTAWFSGYVDTLFADTMYAKVQKGDILAKVYSPEVYKAKQDYLNSLNYNVTHSAPAMLESAKTKLTLLGINKKEIEQIHIRKMVDEFTNIYAPISGWIFIKNINKGSSFNAQKALFQIVNLNNVWMEVRLFQNELKTLDTLTQFEVTVKGLKNKYEAKKSLLYPMLDPKDATVTLRLTLNNKDGALKPGMYAKVHSKTIDKSRLVIPRTAVMRKNGIWYAFLATEFKGEYEPITLEVKPLNTKYYEVTKGLTSEDTIVNNALFMMDSDAQINSIY